MGLALGAAGGSVAVQDGDDDDGGIGGVGRGSSTSSKRGWCCRVLPEEKVALLSDRGGGADGEGGAAGGAADAEQEANGRCCDCIVQFSAETFYCQEGEEAAVLGVVRLGSAAETARVSYTTVDASAKAGLRYIAQEGELVFGRGETSSKIKVGLIDDDSYDATLEFEVHLRNPRGAQLGRYLKACQVIMIDDDAFPTNTYRKDMGCPEDIGRVFAPFLMMEYLRMNLKNPLVRRGTALTLVLLQIKNLYFVLLLYLQLYLVDEVLNKSGEAQYKSRQAIAVGLGYILPFAVCHIIDYTLPFLDVRGKSRLTLQANLLRKFLNLHPNARASLSTGELIMCMTRDVPNLVDNGLMKVLDIMALTCKVVFAFAFILAHNKYAALPLCVFPIIMFAFMTTFMSRISAASPSRAQNALVHMVERIAENRRLVEDFRLATGMVTAIEWKIEMVNKKMGDMARLMTHAHYLVPWLTTLLVGGYIAVGSQQVEEFGGRVTAGTFLATLRAFQQVGKELQTIFVQLVCIQKTFGALRKLCMYLNLPTDLVLRKTANETRLTQGHERRVKMRSTALPRKSLFAIDALDIEMCNLTFQYDQFSRPALQCLSQRFEQGRVYAITGGPRSGKSTFLKLLGGVLLPSPGQGTVCIPPNVRILHLSHGVEAIEESILENIIFDQTLEKAGGISRIFRICERCGCSQAMVNQLRAAAAAAEGPKVKRIRQSVRDRIEEDAFWFVRLSDSDKARLNLVRALVLNPDCIIMHMPFSVFTDEEAFELIQVLRMHVDEHGLDLEPANEALKRPRTVFFSSAAMDPCRAAHAVFKMSSETGMSLISREFDDRQCQP